MKNQFYCFIAAFFCLLLLMSCSTKNKYNRNFPWFLIEKENLPGDGSIFGYKTGYINSNGDTIMPLGKYHCYTENPKHFAIVLSKNKGLIAVDEKEKKLFNAVWSLEPGLPIQISDGMILITKNNKYGYANVKGEIVIEPKYKCAESFFNGEAKVTNNCKILNNEHQRWFMFDYFIINKKDEIISFNLNQENFSEEIKIDKNDDFEDLFGGYK